MTAPHLHTVRVYYEDTDFSGAVYHASYLRFMERARTEMLRARGVSQGQVAFGFVVRSLAIDYLKPARMDDLLNIETTVEKIGGATLDLVQRVLRGAERLTEARVRVACVVNSRPVRIPTHVLEQLRA